MNKLVIKTILITLACAVGALAVVFGALCIFAPVTVAGFFDDVGNYSASVFFYEKQYDKTGDIDDLDVLVLKAYGNSDTVRAEEYLEEMIEHEDFEEFCSGANGANMSDKEYYYGYYALSIAKNGKIDKAISVSKDFVSENGYTKFNPLRTLVSEFLSGATTSEKGKIKAAVESVKTTDAVQEDYKNQDLQTLNK